MRFTQTLQRSKDIYECYNLDEIFIKKNENEEEQNEEEKFQLLYFICFEAIFRMLKSFRKSHKNCLSYGEICKMAL